jgi:hypothetical protein
MASEPSQQPAPLQVTTAARFAGLVLIGIGAWWLLIWGAVVLNRGDASDFLIATGGTAGSGIALGIVLGTLAVVEVMTGVGVLRGKAWGRTLGVVHALGWGGAAALALIAGARSPAGSSDAAMALVILLANVVGYGYTFVVLAFRWRRTPR